MADRFSCTSAEKFLQVTLLDKAPPADFRALLLAIRASADAGAYCRILVDASLVNAPASGMYRFDLGEAIAEVFRRGYRVAVVYRPELITGFAEDVAVNRGASFAVLGSRAAAMKWLLPTEG